MVEQAHRDGTNKESLKPEAQAVLSYLRAGHEISSDVIERELRKLGGIKEIVINPVSYVVKIYYDPRVISAEKMRSVLKKLGQGEQIETRQVPSNSAGAFCQDYHSQENSLELDSP
jgi:copper chaperone CopZ